MPQIRFTRFRKKAANSKAVDPAEKKIMKKEPLKWEFKKVSKAMEQLSPSFQLGTKGRRITGTLLKVRNPKDFNGLFAPGDKLLYIHFETTRQRDAIELVKTFSSKEILKEIQQRGYKGICGDTPNEALAKLFEKHGGTDLKTKIPRLIELRERLRYFLNMLTRSYPRTYLTKPLQRVVLKF